MKIGYVCYEEPGSKMGKKSELSQESLRVDESSAISTRKRLGFTLVLLLFIVVIVEGGMRLGFRLMRTSLRGSKL